jgi:hypothetical protein
MQRWVAPPKTPMSDEQAVHAFETIREFLPEFE